MTLTACSPGSEQGGSGDTAADCETTTDLTVALSWIPNVEFGGFWTADAAGYYASECLDVNWQSGGPNAPLTSQSVAAGSAQLGIAAGVTQLLLDLAEGNDFAVVGSNFQSSPAALISLAEDPIRTAEDLQGARICVQDGVQPLIDAVFNVNDLKPDYTPVTVGYDITPLVDGTCDAYNGFVTNQAVTLETQFGLTESDYVATTFTDLGMPQYSDLIFGQTSWIDANTDVVAAFLSASVKGWQDYLDDPHHAADLAVTEYGIDLALDAEQQNRTAELQVPFVTSADTDEHGLLWVDAATLSGPMLSAQAAAGIPGDAAAVAALVDMGPLSDALAR